MLIICCGMPRSGSTWQYQIASELIEKFASGRRIGFLPAESYLESAYINTEAHQSLVLKCHDYHPYYGQLCKDGLAKAIYTFRDIREVVLSITWILHISTVEAIHSDMLQHAIDSYYFWTATPHILIQRYEKLTSQPEKSISEISAHMGITISKNDANQLAQKFGKDANQNHVDTFKNTLVAQGLEPEKSSIYDQHSLLHWDHIRPASTTKWQDMSPEVLEEMSLVIQKWLVDTGLEKNTDWIYTSSSKKKG